MPVAAVFFRLRSIRSSSSGMRVNERQSGADTNQRRFRQPFLSVHWGSALSLACVHSSTGMETSQLTRVAPGDAEGIRNAPRGGAQYRGVYPRRPQTRQFPSGDHTSHLRNSRCKLLRYPHSGQSRRSRTVSDRFVAQSRLRSQYPAYFRFRNADHAASHCGYPSG